mgnify:FL=1
MDIAILYSGGKDSTYAVDFAKSKGWNVKYLLSVKPTRTDCYCFHYATVENTPLLAQQLGIPHHLISCDVADSTKEAELIKEFVLTHEKVNAVVLGGTGLQQTQIGAIQKALQPFHVEVFAAHAGLEHDEVMQEMVNKGYKFMITQVASDGLGEDWLGFEINKESLPVLLKQSRKFGFHSGGEGGYYDTFTIDGPLFDKKVLITKYDVKMEDHYSGHLVIKEAELVAKVPELIR